MTNNFICIRDILHDTFADIERRMFVKGSASSVKSGFSSLDFYTDGFERGELITVAGGFNSYINIFMLNMAKKITLQKERPLLFIDLDVKNFDNENISIIKLNNENRYIQSPNLNIEIIVSYIKNFQELKPNGIVFINGFNLLHNDNKFLAGKYIDNNIRILKNLIRYLNIPLILSVEISNSKNYFAQLELSKFGIYDSLTALSSKILILSCYETKNIIKRKDLYIDLAKNNFGQTTVIKLGLYEETSTICEIKDEIYNAQLMYI